MDEPRLLLSGWQLDDQLVKADCSHGFFAIDDEDE
jgi:hypothetical protein